MSSTISRDERRELRKLVEETFAYLKAEANSRERQIRRIIENRIKADSADETERARKILAKALHDISALNVDVEYNGYQSSDSEVNLTDFRIEPANLDERVRSEIEDLKSQAEMGHVSLRQEELRIKREITLSALTSVDARAMVETIPSIDKLLPAPESLEIEA